MPASGNRVISYSWFESNPNSSGHSAKVAKHKPYLETQFSVSYVDFRQLSEVTKLANCEATDFAIDTRLLWVFSYMKKGSENWHRILVREPSEKLSFGAREGSGRIMKRRTQGSMF